MEDAAIGTVLAMESKKAAGEIYHIGNIEEITIEDLTRHIGDIVGYKGEYEKAETYPGSVSRRCPEIKKASSDLGYSPKISWKDAVRMTVEWYKEYFDSGRYPKNGGFEPPTKFNKILTK